MTTTCFDSALASGSSPAFSQLQTILIEPLLIVTAAAFWFVALPFVGVSVVCVRIWDTAVALASGNAVRTNSLMLRRSSCAESFGSRGRPNVQI